MLLFSKILQSGPLRIQRFALLAATWRLLHLRFNFGDHSDVDFFHSICETFHVVALHECVYRTFLTIFGELKHLIGGQVQNRSGGGYPHARTSGQSPTLRKHLELFFDTQSEYYLLLVSTSMMSFVLIFLSVRYSNR
jgi:hypothetical protein